jgi:hypothetical protein
MAASFHYGCVTYTHHKGDKYLENIFNHMILKHITQFLVFYTPQGGTEKSDWVSGVRY